MTDPDHRLKLGLAHVTYQRAGPARLLKVLRGASASFPCRQERASLSCLGESPYLPIFLFGGRFTYLSSDATVVRDRSPELFSRCRKSSSKGSRSLYLCEPRADPQRANKLLLKDFDLKGKLKLDSLSYKDY